MPGRLEVISGGKQPEEHKGFMSAEEDLKNFQKVLDNLLRDAQVTWAEVWDSLMGTVTNGTIILSDARNGAKPKCGWAEYLEKLWLLKHYLDYARKFAAGDV